MNLAQKTSVGDMQDSALWQAVLGEIELSVSRGSFMTWFKNTQLIRYKDRVAVIGVPNVFIKNQLEAKYNDLVKSVLEKNGLRPEKVEYKIHTGISVATTDDSDSADEDVGNPGGQSVLTVSSPAVEESGRSYRQGLNERYSFDNFVVGAGNELAYAACQAVVKQPGNKYNPLFLYGGVGIGKTHLIQAVGNAILAAKPNAKVVYASSEQFVREFVDALRFKKNTIQFAGFYRGADVLIVDDVQFLGGKEKVQEEFFHTFNTLQQANKQMIMSADKAPRDIPSLEERLKSRFTMGMTIDLQTPDFETRCAILQSKASAQGIELLMPVAEFLANRVQNNIRELEGILNQVLAFCEMRSVEPDLPTVTAMFENNRHRPKHFNSRHIIERTAKHFHISIEDILGPKRDKDIVVPRQIAMYMLRSELHLSFPKIAHELGRKDHTTAIHSVEKIEKELNLDGLIRQSVNDLKERLYA